MTTPSYVLVLSLAGLFAVGCKEAEGGCPVDGLDFESVEILECGLTPPDSGNAGCHWQIHFASGEFTWQHSDLGSSGAYECNGNTITTSKQSIGASVVGTWDPSTKTLSWDGHEYVIAGDD